MNVDELLAKARDGMTVSRVYGKPQVHDGVTLIPAAVVVGGGGGGGGARGGDGHDGEGGGFGLFAHPVGAYVIKDGQVRWVPAIDVNLAVVVVAATARAIIRFRKRGRR